MRVLTYLPNEIHLYSNSLRFKAVAQANPTSEDVSELPLKSR